MKNGSQLEYNIINEYKKILENTGTCVIDKIGMYGEALGLQENILNQICRICNQT